ncbi:unnamed protein product [Durusdinium trenchii]|uniref:Uncharacterized protein n=1 Tax=Durusdinium trenchii TaxID=1381693 RepID=A0ABP0KZU3_9DINO
MGAKRKSGDGPGSAKQPKLTDAPLKVPVEALLKERVQRFDKWLGVILNEHNSLEKYMTKTLVEDQDHFQKLWFATNADEPGVEKIAICKVNTELLTEPIPVQGDSMNEYLPPMSVFYVKGFTRCFCAVAVLLYAYKNQDVLEAGLDGP